MGYNTEFQNNNTELEEILRMANGLPDVGVAENGATFIPSVSADGVISWTNDKGLDNPEPVNIKGDPYTLTEADKAVIVSAVLANFTDVSEVAL